MKSSVEKIRARFDGDVERFSNLETGQTATMDAALCLELVTAAAAAVTPGARDLLDIGCGAGNYTLKMLQRVPGMNCTLVDLSKPMLDRAVERVAAAGGRNVRAMQGDMREIDMGKGCYDIVLAAATLHHLRTDAEWRGVVGAIFAALRPGGSFWVFDMVEQVDGAVPGMMWARYGAYLSGLKGGGEAGAKYREGVFAYIEEEDTPRSLPYQMERMREAGFEGVDVLHKNGPFAAFGGCKRG
ncbi:MAG: class I SAM-dependent methyltransferase [Phycisphaerae bacterium]